MTDHEPAPTPSLLWTPADLAARWRCSVATVLRRVREKRVPYLWLGRGEHNFGRRGRAFIRFRPASVERWEAEQEGLWQPTAEGDEAQPVPARVPVRGLARGQRAWRGE